MVYTTFGDFVQRCCQWVQRRWRGMRGRCPGCNRDMTMLVRPSEPSLESLRRQVKDTICDLDGICWCSACYHRQHPKTVA